ncbi:hypothetical protein EVAR_40614_1 [Eumeta japonica]|uniref:Uncharacterized protein n=1 Tax=Eumeta variegata TaxID=151549 RepID=A0A4C1XG52_EUMVA|nr:hypothetical protein EVAR_40614_1 [Eumeta japonica]
MEFLCLPSGSIIREDEGEALNLRIASFVGNSERQNFVGAGVTVVAIRRSSRRDYDALYNCTLLVEPVVGMSACGVEDQSSASRCGSHLETLLTK